MDSLEQIDQIMAGFRVVESSNNYTAIGPQTKYGNATGAYQFLNSTWGGYGGYTRAADAPPEVQDERARQLMTTYFNEFGSWALVAVAWHAGPGKARKAQAQGIESLGGLSDGYTQTQDYAQKVINAAGLNGADGELSEFSREPLTEEEIEAEVRESYPDYAFLLDNPEIRPILLEAADPNRGLDDATFESRIRNTEWFQTTSQSARTWETRKQLDPATAQREKASVVASLKSQALVLGVDMSTAELDRMAEDVLKYGLSETEITNRFAEEIRGDAPAGQAARALNQMRAQASEYMVNMTPTELAQWSQGVVTGTRTLDDYTQRLADLSRAKFAGNETISKLLDQGSSPGSFFSDHRAMLAREWDVPQESIALDSDRWAQVLQYADENGNIRPMTLSEARSYSRRQEGWENTSAGKAKVAESTQALLRAFGKVR